MFRNNEVLNSVSSRISHIKIIVTIIKLSNLLIPAVSIYSKVFIIVSYFLDNYITMRCFESIHNEFFCFGIFLDIVINIFCQFDNQYLLHKPVQFMVIFQEVLEM